MTRAELKQQAKDSLKGRWGTAVAMVLVYELILSGLSIAASFIPGLGSIAVFVISVPLAFGFIGQMLKFSRGEEVGLCDYFKIGFDNFGKSWSITGYTILKLLPAIIVYVLSFVLFFGMSIYAASTEEISLIVVVMLIGVSLIIASLIFMYIKSYLYVLTEYIGNDNSELDGKACVEQSEKLMKGHRLEFFVLQLSFIGWILLSIITFGIGFLFLEPYMEVTNAKFYDSLAENNNTNN